MKIKSLLSLIVLAGAVTLAKANNCNYLPGNITCHKTNVNKLSGSGIFKLLDTTLLGPAQLNGTAELNQCSVTDDARIRGYIKATSSQFDKSLNIYANSSSFNKSTIFKNIL